MRRLQRRLVVPLFALTVCPQALHAETAATTMSVGATITSNCMVRSSALDFGAIDAGSSEPVDGSSDIMVSCTNGTAWTASASVGSGDGGFTANRSMSNGGAELGYGLFVNAERSLLWGDGVESGTSTISGVGSGTAESSAIYGRIHPGQDQLPAGSYGDTVMVTITY